MEDSFTDNKYSRLHHWSFDNGVKLKASSSPQVVPVPMSDASVIDPEEAFIAALSSCHMLFFLSIAARESYVIERYEDRAEGVLSKNDQGEMAMTHITLMPRVIFSGQHKVPEIRDIQKMHDQAHKRCFLANSIQSKINIIVDKS